MYHCLGVSFMDKFVINYLAKFLGIAFDKCKQ